jgi:triacylglycerol esterase/lipase EstA (alpha/beta hydrolase family)
MGGIAFEFFSMLMVCNLYPFGLKKEKNPSLLSYQNHKRPILLIHGIFHNHSAFFKIKRELLRHGWDKIYTINLSTYSQGIEDLAVLTEKKIDAILEQTNADKVDIIAHSLGGIIARYYIQILTGHQKVKHCITLGTPHQGTLLSKVGIGKSIKELRPTSGLIKKLGAKPLPKSVSFTSFWSPFDLMVWPSRYAQIKNDSKTDSHIQNIEVPNTGHAGLLFSKEVFYKIATILDNAS